MEQVYVPRKGDDEIIQKYFLSFSNKSNQELIDAYNHQKRIFGVHQQLLYLVALDKVFNERFGKSPISNEDNTIFGLSGRIVYYALLNTFETTNEN